ncbi:MAG: response regulator transcription factor [Acidobacteriota bacterium]
MSQAITSAHIAIVDDEDDIRETVGYSLRREGFRVEAFPDGQEAWDSFQQGLPDLLVLDILMPRMDGLELCRRVRALSEEVPILFLTSKDDEFDRVLGLELGADDYLCKPFSMRELLARARVLLRRLALIRRSPQPNEEELLAIGALTLDLQRYAVTWKQQAVQLTVTEFLLLQALTRRPGHVKSRRQLMEEAYPHDAYVSERTIDSHIKRLRKKFVRHDSDFDGIETVYGVGYRYRDADLPMDEAP